MSPRTGPRSWLVPFFANTLLVQLVTFVLRPTVIYRAIELDVPAQWLGALGASFAIVPLVLAVPTGQVADRFGERRVMVAGAGLTVAATLLFLAVGDSVWGLLAGSVALGTGHLASVVAQQALVANRTESSRYDSAFGHYTFAASAGQALGPGLIVIFGGSSAIPDTATIFAWSVGISGLLLASALLLPSPGTRSTGRTAATSGTVRDLLRRKGLVRALTISSVVLAAVDISLVYLPVLGSERGISSGVIGLLLATRAASSMVSRFFLGRLSARFGRGRLLTSSIVMAALGMALVPAPMPTWLLVAVVVVMGFGLGAGQPLTMSWLAEATPPGLRGRAMSLRLTGNRLGQVVVPSAAGALALGGGAAGVLIFTATALALAAATSTSIPRSEPPTTV